jgi:hypothetical protein
MLLTLQTSDQEFAVGLEEKPAEDKALDRFLAVMKTGKMLHGDEIISLLEKATYPIEPAMFLVPGLNHKYQLLIEQPLVKNTPSTDKQGKKRTLRVPYAHATQLAIVHSSGSETTVGRNTAVISVKRSLQAWRDQNPGHTPASMLFLANFPSNQFAFNRVLHDFSDEKLDDSFKPGHVHLTGQDPVIPATIQCWIQPLQEYKGVSPKIAIKLDDKQARVFNNPYNLIAFYTTMRLLDINRLKFDPFEL